MKLSPLAFVFLLVATGTGAATLVPDPPRRCDNCDDWNAAQKPFRVYGDTWYVGTHGLSSVLIASGDGLIVLDGGLPQSAPLIAANIESLGYRVADIKLIVNSHAHYDHAGGIAALARASGARVVASAAGAAALRRGEPTKDDPQYAFGHDANAFPAVARVDVVADGETVRVGNLAVTAHLTPGHTPGRTTWTWRSCEGERCLDIVYADSLNAVSAPEFRFGDGATFRRSIAAVAALPCDIVLSVHPDVSGTFAKLERRERDGAADAFVDPTSCRAYANGAASRIEQRLATEKAGATAR
jgi:metallo-beta-lactamase class B